MVLVLKKARLFLAFSFVASIYLVGYYLTKIALHIEQQIITVDPSLSQALQSAVTDLLVANLDQKPAQRFVQLKNNFGMIEQFKTNFIGLNKIHTQFSVVALRYRLGKDLVLANSGQVFLASDFKEQVTTKLPAIYLAQNFTQINEIQTDLINFLLNLPEFILNDFEVHWHSANHIVLHSRPNWHSQNKVNIIVRHDQFLTPALLLICKQLITTYQQDRHKACGENIKIDVRFAQQVIISC